MPDIFGKFRAWRQYRSIQADIERFKARDLEERQCIREMIAAWITYNKARPPYLDTPLLELIELLSLPFFEAARSRFKLLRDSPNSSLWSLLLTAVLLSKTHPRSEVKKAVAELKYRHHLHSMDPPLLDKI